MTRFAQFSQQIADLLEVGHGPRHISRALGIPYTTCQNWCRHLKQGTTPAGKVAPPGKIRRLFWDIETAPNVCYVWRTGYKLRVSPQNIVKERAVICICYKWEHDDTVHTLRWNAEQCDRDMLQEFLPIAQQADELVAHNGDRFDLKWFNGRCLKHGLKGHGSWKTVDTLKMAKSRFALNSYTLHYLGEYLLGDGKAEHGGFSTWVDIIEKNCPDAMARMVHYCQKDVVLLQDIFERMQPYTKPRTHVGVLNRGAKWTCPWTGSNEVVYTKPLVTSAGTVQRQMRSLAADSYYTISNRAYLQFLEERTQKSA